MIKSQTFLIIQYCHTHARTHTHTHTHTHTRTGAYIPNLKQLRLVNSHVPCVRDLGTCLGRVEVLWLPRCKLKDLDGLPALSSLRELYLAFNEVTDISLITMLSSLELLDLER